MTDQNYRILGPEEVVWEEDVMFLVIEKLKSEDTIGICAKEFAPYQFRRPIPPVAKSATTECPKCGQSHLSLIVEHRCDPPVKESLTTEETNWPNCKEAQCAVVHDYLDSLLASLGVDCPKHYYSVAKAIHVSEALKKVELAFAAMKLRAEKAGAEAKEQKEENEELSKDLCDMEDWLLGTRGTWGACDGGKMLKERIRDLIAKEGELGDAQEAIRILSADTAKLQTAERERDDYKASVGDLAKTCSELIKERDALRAELENIKKDRCEECGTKLYFGPPCCPRCGAPNCCPLCCMVAATESLRAENARLREVLEKIVNTNRHQAFEIAQAALAGKGETAQQPLAQKEFNPNPPETM